MEDPNIIYGGPLPSDCNRGCSSLGELIIRQLAKESDKLALINGVNHLQLTYGAILDQSLAIAGFLSELGIQRNDVVALLSENRFEYPVTIFAAFYLGASVALFNPVYTQRELEHAIKVAKPKVVFVSAQANLVAQKACMKIRRPVKFVHFENGDSKYTWHKCLENSDRKLQQHSFVPVAVNTGEQIALIVMSSGTTGLPKAVQITQQNLISTFPITEEFLTSTNQTESVFVDVIPWFHVAGGVSMINWLINGTRLVFLPKFSPANYLRCIQHYRPNMLNIVPPIAVLLAKSPIVNQFDVSSVKTIICGAAPLSREVEDLVRSRLKVPSIRQAYGMSETTLAVLVQMDAENKPGSVGRIRAGQWVKVVDTESGRPLGPFQSGELCFKGTLIMKGYIGNEEAIDGDGWLHTGDIGYYDDERDFYIVDRLKELIKYKAYQVPPAELEAIILSHPKVKDAAVVGMPDERVGELAVAFVVPTDGERVAEQEIVSLVERQVSEQKWLHGGVRFIEEIPKTASGKILRRKLREIARNKAKL
ncbi:uncharacterized protein LOC129776390 [Toxorhynchites rutilus septentrionalis]|uniref:uncharacterized protein LOC129776390 n=1 Tax=Toxorhynchites rutilus septentrionalis TaxID=329112 RepID=UPI00247A03A3|nr:uncharacterized protein LOC129776390 [Toxorhynchites rutilus septentrionalis]